MPIMRYFLPLLLAAHAFATDFHAHLTSANLDVYVGQSSEKPADVPGAEPAKNYLVVSVKTTNDWAQAVMVWVMIRLDDQTRTARHAILERDPVNPTVFRFLLGERRAIELVAINVDNLEKLPGGTLTMVNRAAN